MKTLDSNAVKASVPQIPHEVSALLSALQLRNPRFEALLALSDSEWASLLRFSDPAHLTLLLAKLEVAGIPAWVADRLQANLDDNARRFERVRSTYLEAAQALDDAGVEHIVIKGFTQAPDYVPDARLRQQSDLDFLCKPHQIAQAQSALESLGYRPDPYAEIGNADHTPAMVRPTGWQWRGNAFDPDMPLSIELHFCLWNEPVALFAVPETDSFWDRRVKRHLDGIEFFALDPVDHLGHLCLHILRNLFLRDRIVHHVHELAVFLHARAGDEAFLSRWKTTHSAKLREREAIAFFYAAAWFGCDLHPAIKDQIESLPQRQLEWLRYYTWSNLENMFRTNKDSVWLHLEMLSGPKQKALLFQRSFLPSATTRLQTSRVIAHKRKPVDFDNKHPYRRYMAYFFARSYSHVRMNLSTLKRGLDWRLSQHQLAREFWIFLAASFFLTWACPSTSFSSISF